MKKEKRNKTRNVLVVPGVSKVEPYDILFGERTNEILFKAEYMHSNVNPHRSKELRLTRLLKQDLLTENFKSLEWSEL
ncbi:MAG: hypothetical protein A2499_10130 [Stygiobacter sp. RIFOXYC12_FULL_38_8]|nr:MAG: hypothetical protein A2X62_10295 [Stygiobacter sp. GWC2_38_9]OGU83981.1 MAG: hypothetical protein A2279_12205 [Stygiobacter sp. RIFOXYA12_FULL_38_9]OGV07435.1 MAG: hypothetical protein A2299_17655 [Stygiobacter sp. RIFOXYB2_FULL_37_11]OGV12268.1 MAG: hypothetical protein A2237_16330 [Stygiobacter sp. RIFOXYA2_FULL_38_8]OGV13693.1 MAG: hypothetical protein A2440_11050 [Stygiobacter sp. RIFOXYC2_FULL_38_25]OGV29726.1 MAG: hypothetical protein A2499_10130 [Stygiobacter sp. RIFOXYC12_FULL_